MKNFACDRGLTQCPCIGMFGPFGHSKVMLLCFPMLKLAITLQLNKAPRITAPRSTALMSLVGLRFGQCIDALLLWLWSGLDLHLCISALALAWT